MVFIGEITRVRRDLVVENFVIKMKDRWVCVKMELDLRAGACAHD